ncbi:PEP-CTERM sorting domain-containing protein [Aeoliella sp. SH292]|uniref:PEP-CTERM sorting domain-containing protein n=1 Tax=Aeoliella sp. SH292 TaxID=3454464 RepID=UPI003F988772
MKRNPYMIAAIAVLLGLGTAASHASTVLVGGLYEVDTDLTVKSLTSSSGSFNVVSHDYDDLFALDYNWGSSNDTDLAGQQQERLSFNTAPTVAGPGSSILAGFLNPVTNGAGIDVIFFESGDAPTTNQPGLPEADWLNPLANNQIELLAVSVDRTAGSWVDVVVLDFLTGDEVGEDGVTDYGVYVYGLDLSTLGIADGATVSQLYVGNTVGSIARNPDVVYAAGANVIPEPSTIAILGIAGVAGLAMVRRRRQG